MRAIESQDPDRHLIGFEDRLKGRDRIKEKVSDTMEEVAPLQKKPSQSSLTRFGTRFSTQKLTTLKVSGRTSDV